MQFNSFVFILGFLPLILILYFLSNKISITLGKITLALAGAIFYAYAGWQTAVIFSVSILVNYGVCLWLNKNNRPGRGILILDIILNIGLLFYFKYSDFFMENLYAVLDREYTSINLILPLGISFFTFQQIMYVVNIYQKKIISNKFIDYITYILYFPKLVMGPLVEPKMLIDQLDDRGLKGFSPDNLAYGIKIFSYGLFKKMILADTFATAVSWGFKNVNSETSMDLILVMLFYTLEIYFDFSGYCDMAVGVSKMFNISLPMNFDSPYKAVSIRDFWKRWHMSLTGFLTKYIYIPLGGSRKGKMWTYVNIMIVFIVSGIWHGANWTFILWGV